MNRLFTLLTLILFSLSNSAQELKVKSFILDSSDITASSKQRKDGNGDPCALVKVLLAAPGATFDGNIVGNVDYNVNQYKVYLTSGSKRMQVNHPNYLPLDVTFADYGVNSVKGKLTYTLTITMPSVASNEPVDAGGNFAVLTIKPENAIVSIDNRNLAIDPSGQYMPMLSYGQHSYQVSCTGYLPKSGSFTIGKGNTTELNVSLESALATLTVKCPTAGATIYVDKKSMGTSPWTGSLQDGMHLIEAKKDGHRSVQKSITLAEQQKLTVSLDALTPILGNMSVSYRPVGADIYIDGKKSGTSPYVFNGILVGSHRVEIKKDGYTSETKTVSISEGQTSSLQGSLNAIAQTSTTPQATSSGSDILTFRANGVSFNMIKVVGGTFTMGATSEQGSDVESCEKPTHQVTLSSYHIGKTEVTQALWTAVMGSNPSKYKGNDLPVENVSWDDCQQFIRKLNSLTGKRFRLPTEAEWEYAARGGNKSRGYKYSGSNNISDVAWYENNSSNKTHPVGAKLPNELGIYDMSGNVWELCSDWYRSYSGGSWTNPAGATSGAYRVRRGGGCLNLAGFCRSSVRGNDSPGARYGSLGFRLCLSE